MRRKAILQILLVVLLINTSFQLLELAPGIPRAYALPQSSRVALVPSPSGEAGNGGSLPTNPSGGWPNGNTFTFVNLAPSSIANDAANPIVAGVFDTVVFVQLYFQYWWSQGQFASRIASFVSNGGKLIIYDSEITDENYSAFIYPFSESAPGPQGSMNGKIWIVENNSLGTNDTASYSYVNTAAIGSQTEIGDANTMVTQDSHWKTHMVATNLLLVTGPVHTYAEYGKGLILWNGQDMDPFYLFQAIDNANGADAMGMMWYLELKQGFNPTNPPLPGSISTAGLSLTPTSATNPLGTIHAVTATVTDQLAQPVPNTQVSFTIVGGPNAGLTGSGVTNSTGQTSFSWTSNIPGTDIVIASTNPFGTIVQAQASKNWTMSAQIGPVYYSVEPIATPPLTDIDPSINRLETPPGPSPVGHVFIVEIHLRNATVDNVPTGVAGVEAHFYFGNITTYAVPIGFIDCVGAVGGVLVAPVLYALGPGFFDADGNLVTTAPYTGAVEFKEAAATYSAGWNAADGIVAKIAFRIIKQPQGSNGEPAAYLPLVNDFTDLVYEPEPFSLPVDVRNNDVQGSLMIDNDGKTVVGENSTFTVNVKVVNDAAFTFAFNVTAYANTTSVASENVTLSSGNSTIVTLTWNTTASAYGNYAISVSTYAWPVPGEQPPANSTYIDAWIVITIPGDLRGDFKVTLVDLVVLANAYGSKPGDPKWDPNADINGDGKVSLADLVLMAMHYGQHYP